MNWHTQVELKPFKNRGERVVEKERDFLKERSNERKSQAGVCEGQSQMLLWGKKGNTDSMKKTKN